VKITLIITTYNWPEALKLVLKSALNQSVLADEIIIADDGSTQETTNVINEFSEHLHLKHIWQKDQGFQKTIILNKSIAQASGDYIIQIDGDIIMHPNFIKDHKLSSDKGQFIHGSRSLLDLKLTKISIEKEVVNFSTFQKGIKNSLNTINSKILSSMFSKINKTLKGTRGCNFSFWKDDFIAANGYNEEMIGWGKEDTELSVRLMNTGLKKKHLKFNANCYHLYHKLVEREGLNINKNILSETILKKKTSCKKGINQYAN